jgi:REP-associated tyrosine transposase
MPYTKVMLHFIWATKSRQPLISKELKPVLLDHIKENSIRKGLFIDCLNCMEEHIHLLISLGVEQTISKIAMLIKGESSFWVNQQNIISRKFEWQDDYIALSVSESAVVNVRQYIANQEEHHKRKTFAQEYEEFLTAHGLSANNFG